MPRQYIRWNVRLLTLLIVTNGFSFILGFQSVSRTRSTLSRREHQWAAIPKFSPLFCSDEDDESEKDSPHPEFEFFLGRSESGNPSRGLDRRVLEEASEEDVFEFSSRFWIYNILEYKDNRDPIDSSKSAFEKEALPEKKLISMDELYKIALQKNLDNKISMDELYKIALQKNLPKKKPISMHSFISSMSAMAALLLVLPTFHPGIDEFGLPRLFSYEYASNDLLWQSQLVALMQMVSSILGVFRLPKHSPNVRTVGFVLSALIVTQLSLVVMSSLNGTDIYLFDAFSMQGRILISVINTTLMIGSLDSIAMILGDKEKKGWETVPGYGSRSSAFLTSFPFHILICMNGNAVLPVLCDKQSFVENALPFFSIFPGVQTLGYVATSLAVGLGALLATLQFENKISNEVASFWNIAIISFLTYDGVKFMYLLAAFPERFAHSEYFVSYTPHLQSLWHTNEVLVIGTILSLMVGLQNWSKATLFASRRRKEMSLALETPSATDESAPLEDRAFQVITDLELIQKNKESLIEYDNSTNSTLKG